VKDRGQRESKQAKARRLADIRNEGDERFGVAVARAVADDRVAVGADVPGCAERTSPIGGGVDAVGKQ
jgi:hypothetical protein